jgi:hypothetical protein
MTATYPLPRPSSFAANATNPLANLDSDLVNLTDTLNALGNGAAVLNSVTITTASITAANISLMQGNVYIAGGSASFTQANVSTIYAGNVSATNFVGSGALLTGLAGASSVAGDSRNLVAKASNNTVVTITFDQVVTSTALSNGTTYLFGTNNLTFNRNTIGVGGLDTGSSPNLGWISIYAVSNPGTSAIGLLGLAGNAASTTLYSGANTAPGYTASSLVSIWPTDGTGNLIFGTQQSRVFSFDVPVIVATGQTFPSSLTQQSISPAVPPAAKSVSGFMGVTSTAAPGMQVVASDANGLDAQIIAQLGTGSATLIFGFGSAESFRDLMITTPQIMYLMVSAGGVAGAGRLAVTGYKF